MAGGRPNKYDTNIQPYLREIQILRSNGVEYETIANMLNIAQSTLYKHKAQIEEFMESIKKSDEGLILELEKSLYSLAKGTYLQVREKIVYEGNTDVIKSREVTKEYGKPELGANIFALINLASDKWKNKREETVVYDDENITPSFEAVVQKNHEESTQ